MPGPVADEDDADLQAAIAMSMAAAEAEQNASKPEIMEPEIAPVAAPVLPSTPPAAAVRNHRTSADGEFTMRAEDLFDAPVDKKSNSTGAEIDFSSEGNGAGSKAGEIAAKALDMPISTSHSP